MKKILILTDGKAGHENQSKALARALGFQFDLAGVFFKSRFSKALSYLLDRLGVNSTSLFSLKSEVSSTDYAAVIGTGSGTFYAVKTLAKKWRIPCAVVLFPRGYSLDGFNSILAPSFDRPPEKDNVITLPVNLVAADEAFYDEGERAFRDRYCPKENSMKVSVIVGGPNKCSRMTADWMKEELEKLFEENRAKASKLGKEVEFWVTTSRRTPKEVEEVIDGFAFDYKLLFSKDCFNPIPAFVKLSDKIYVTAESTGMLSEVCTFGKAKILALDNLNPGPHKFRRFIEDLSSLNMIGGSKKADLDEPLSKARSALGLAPAIKEKS
jgi:mitochondrial fission protein ELM1